MKEFSIRVRINKIEKELIKKKADILNMNVSEYIRFISINGEVKK